MSKSETDMAYELTRYLVEKTGYERTSPIESAVREKIGKLTRDIAETVVAANPKLNAVIEARVTAVIQEALRDDAFLNQTMAHAVAEALGQIVKTRKDEIEE